MRVLHIAPRLSQRGGADQHLLALLQTQAARGDPIELLVGTNDGSVSAPCPTSLLVGIEARTSQVLPQLDTQVERWRPEVLHLHNPVNPWLLQWAAGRPAVLTIQDHRFFCPGRGKWTGRGEVCRTPLGPRCTECLGDPDYASQMLALTRQRLAAAAALPALVVLSDYMRRELVAAGCRPERIAVIPPFVHGLDPRAAPVRGDCVLFVGRLAEAKGVPDAVAAWRESDVGVPLVLAGSGPLRQALGHERGVEVLGWLPHHDLAGLLRSARALLLPSRWQEPFGIAGLEARSFGVPVVAWESGGVVEWHGAQGLGPWGDRSALAEGLRRAVHQPAEAPSGGSTRDELMARLDDVYSAVARG